MPSGSIYITFCKLQMLGYETDFIQRFELPQITPSYFLTPAAQSGEQLHYFASLCCWLFQLLGNPDVSAPGRFDDPSAMVADIIVELDNLNLNSDEIQQSKLKPGYGDVVIKVLEILADAAIKSHEIRPTRPDWSEMEEDRGEDSGEDIEDEISEFDEIDDFSTQQPHQIGQKSGDLSAASSSSLPLPLSMSTARDGDISSEIHRVFDEIDDFSTQQPHQIGQKSGDLSAASSSSLPLPLSMSTARDGDISSEIHRVVSNLRVRITSHTDNWEEKTTILQEAQVTATSPMQDVLPPITSLSSELTMQLEKVSTREQHLNSTSSDLISSLRDTRKKNATVHTQREEAIKKVSDLRKQTSEVQDEVDDVKAQIEKVGTIMRDAKPLVEAKAALSSLKKEIQEMDMKLAYARSGVLTAALHKQQGLNSNAK
ncbi:Intra-flagellar transport protein 57 like protein [Aduncisulcus paluster]|uniref:Intra-flagellar transport protein 57 like protein n=1 Tax=Aduncisulcus paluster TaxID=2918883 RepID=A0ABQ5KWU6_9EUKA|nr:Intra-flagellar transport protein 57 like protein [Aduncisulcus paluster]